MLIAPAHSYWLSFRYSGEEVELQTILVATVGYALGSQIYRVDVM